MTNKDWSGCSCCSRQKLIGEYPKVVIEFAFDNQMLHSATEYIASLPRKPIGVLREKMLGRRPQETKAALLVLMQDYVRGRKLRPHELGDLGTRGSLRVQEFKCKNLRIAFYETTCAQSPEKTIVRLTNGFTKTGQTAPAAQVNKAHAIAAIDKGIR